MPQFALGLDFGTESGRALVVNVATGEIVGSAVHRYADGVIDEHLPGTSIALEPDTALQNPSDYIETLKHAVPEALQQGGVRAGDVIGIGVDFTACTILPTRADGTPLCTLDEFKANPHAWVKLWKHHAAQPEADRINALARERNEPWLALYGGRISSEWYHSKTLQILNDAPEIYQAADRIVEGGDWIVWQMTGVLKRNACAAGYKALWQKGVGYPSNDFLCALDPRLDRLNETKLAGEIVAPGTRVGVLTERTAQWMGLRPGIAVAAATIDAHAAVPGAGVTEPGRMVLILGTSTCHMILDRARHLVPGISGVVEEGILPGWFGYEAGQVGVGDLFEWFVAHNLDVRYAQRAQARGISPYQLLEEEAAKLQPGESGLLALDWWNGCRTPLVDANLSGADRWVDARHTCTGDLSRAHRGDGVRDANHHRDVRAEWCGGERTGRVRWFGGAKQVAVADLCRCDRARVCRGGVGAYQRARRGDAGRVRGGTRRRRLRLGHRSRATNVPGETRDAPAERRASRNVSKTLCRVSRAARVLWARRK
jgi:L-ribulokinase